MGAPSLRSGVAVEPLVGRLWTKPTPTKPASGGEGSLASMEVVVELLRTKCMAILLCGLDACPSRQLRS